MVRDCTHDFEVDSNKKLLTKAFILFYIVFWGSLETISKNIKPNVILVWLFNKRIYPKSFRRGKDVIQGQFLSRVKLVWIQCFPSFRPVP